MRVNEFVGDDYAVNANTEYGFMVRLSDLETGRSIAFYDKDELQAMHDAIGVVLRELDEDSID